MAMTVRLTECAANKSLICWRERRVHGTRGITHPTAWQIETELVAPMALDPSARLLTSSAKIRRASADLYFSARKETNRRLIWQNKAEKYPVTHILKNPIFGENS